MTINRTGGTVVFSSVSTTDATPTTAATYAVDDDAVAVVRVRILARNSSTGDVSAWELRCAIKRYGGGNVVLVGGVQHLLRESDAGHRLWSADLVVSGTSLIARVKGEAATNIDWSAHIDTAEMYIT